MWKAIVYKELRENLGLGLLALAVYLFMATTWVGPNVWPWSYAHSDYSIPFVDDGFNYLFAWVTGLLAVSIGLRQTIPESVRSTWLFLLHRPINRRRAVVLKLLTGASVYLLFSAVPILVYGLWAAAPRTHASPFEWSMTLTAWQLWLSITAIYQAAFLVGVRPGRWIGSRLLPLVAAGLCVALIQVVPSWWILGLTSLVVLNVLLAVCTLFVTRTRDFG